MSKKFKFGVLGLKRGLFVLRCAKVLSDEMEVVAVCENDPEALKAAQEQEGLITDNIKIFDDYDEFINCGLDAVVLCDFFTGHAQHAIKAMEAGVAVFSETTAAPSLGECVQLVEAYEKTKTKYMLSSNCVFLKIIQEMKKQVQSNKFGLPIYGDAEYVHGPANRDVYRERDIHNTHWRDTLPSCYYNMHDLGPMMYILNTIPKKVVGKAVLTNGGPLHGKIQTSQKNYGLVEMDNGIVVNYSGCCSAGSTSKWYRIGCQFGSIESERLHGDGNEKIVTAGLMHDKENPDDMLQLNDITWSSCGILTKEEEDRFFNNNDIDNLHGGVDIVMVYHYLKFLKGEFEPFFDVYNSVALSAAGIMTWYSALSGSIELELPDFKDKASRDKVRNDFRMPFAKDIDDITLPFNIGDKENFKL